MVLRKCFTFLAAILLAASAGLPALAQKLDGSLRLEITDASGAAIPDAKVTVTNDSTNVSATQDGGSVGTYVFPNLLVGSYTVVIEKSSFKKYVRKNVQVGANQITEVKAKLDVGTVDTVVLVESGADLVQTSNAELSAQIGGRLANEVPIATAGGSVLEYAVLLPNTTTQPGGVLGSGGSVGGTRPRFNGFTIDGVDDNRADVNGPITPVIQDSVQEFTLLANQFSAEYGHSAGGQFAITTKSGTNNWHGEGHEYNRNRNYNALDNSQKLRNQTPGVSPGFKDRFDYNRVGASVGGPILKDKLFLFGAYEYQTFGGAASSPTVTLPTAAGLATLNGLAANSAVRSILAQFPAAPTASGTVTVNGTPIPVGTFQSLAPNFTAEHDFNINVDANLGKHQLRTRFLWDRQRAPDFNPNQPQAQFLGAVAFDARKAIITDAWTLSHNVVNDFRASYSRNVGPGLVLPSAFVNFPNVEIDGLGINTGPDPLSPQGYTQNVYQISNNLTWVKGHHTIKGGLEWRHWVAPTVSLPRARGEWDYTDLQQFINDEVPQGANGALRGVGSGTFAGNYNALYWFLQDDLKLTSRLTVNLGLRYEWSGVPRDSNTQAGNAIADDPNFGIFFRAPKSDINNFAPRFGFAYDVRGDGKWAVRGGVGLAYDVAPVNFAINQQAPQNQFENNPALTCAVAPATPWCASFVGGGAGAGFLAAGGLSPFITPSTQPLARALTQGLILDAVAPKVLTWSLGVQHELLKSTSVELRYLGTHSVSLPVQIRLNEASAFDAGVPGGGLTPLPTFFSAAGVPTTLPLTSTRRAAFTAFKNNGDNCLPGGYKPLAADGFCSVFTAFPSVGQGIYHAGSVDVTHRLSHGLYIRGNYTFAKNIDDATNELFSSRVNPRRPEDARNVRAERGRSALDINHKLVLSWVYDLPRAHVSNGVAKGFLHGWSVTGTYLAQTGQPVTLLSNTDSNVNGSSAGDRAIFNPNGTANTGSLLGFVCLNGAGATSTVTSIGACPGGDANIAGYYALNPTARFVQAGRGARSTLGRDTFGTPGLNIWNMALIKNTKINERFSVQFRAETYDTFNHRNFSIGLPSNNGANDQINNPNPLSTTYSFVTAGSLFLNAHAFNGGSRALQLGVKLIF